MKYAVIKINSSDIKESKILAVFDNLESASTCMDREMNKLIQHLTKMDTPPVVSIYDDDESVPSVEIYDEYEAILYGFKVQAIES